MHCKCTCNKLDFGRAFDGRRAYRCKVCGNIWTDGMQGRQARYSPQRQGHQFKDTGATNHKKIMKDIEDFVQDFREQQMIRGH